MTDRELEHRVAELEARINGPGLLHCIVWLATTIALMVLIAWLTGL